MKTKREYLKKRERKLKQLMRRSDVDALLLMNLHASSLDPTIYYFSGVRLLTYAALLVPVEGNSLLIVSKGDYERASEKFDNVMKTENMKRDLRNTLRELKVRTLAINSRFFTLEMKRIVGRYRLKDFSRQIYELRMIKDDGEIKCIRKAVRITKKAIHETLEKVKPGMKENEVRASLEYVMKNEGADGFAFPSIVISGRKTSNPHGITSKKKVKEGELLLIDCGAKYNEYCSDITRVACVGGEMRKEEREVYEIVREAQKEAIKNAKPGLTNFELDSIARRVIKEYGYDIPHGLGHGFGLEIHEEPSIAYMGYKATRKVELKENMTITVEPGIYIPRKFGIRVEDDILITKSGCKLL